MKLSEYLQARHPNGCGYALSALEAAAFGIDWPMPHGWTKQELEISDATLHALFERMKVRSRVSAVKGMQAFRRLGFSVVAINLPIQAQLTGLSKKQRRKLRETEKVEYRKTVSAAKVESRVIKKSDKTAPHNPMPVVQKAARVDAFIKNSQIDPRNDEFLRSFEWRALRMKALELHGPVCQCCGASPRTGAVINVDHIKPRRDFPHLALTLDNLQILCNVCNSGKGSWSETDWRKANYRDQANDQAEQLAMLEMIA